MSDGSKEQVAGPPALTVGKVMSGLTPSQLWGVGVALFSLIGGAFAFGSMFRPLASKIINQPNTCATMPGYPMGDWFVRAVKVNIGRQDTTFADAITFTHSKGGTWYAGEGKQLPDGSYPRTVRREFTSNAAPNKGAKLTLTFTDVEDSYKAEGEIFVSADGCSMTGSSKNYSNGQLILDASAEYCWYQAPQCPPSPMGWRPYRIVGTTNVTAEK